MIELIITLAVIGFVVWLITTYIPMAEPFRTGIFVLAAILVLLYLLRVFGFADIPIR